MNRMKTTALIGVVIDDTLIALLHSCDEPPNAYVLLSSTGEPKGAKRVHARGVFMHDYFRLSVCQLACAVIVQTSKASTTNKKLPCSVVLKPETKQPNSYASPIALLPNAFRLWPTSSIVLHVNWIQSNAFLSRPTTSAPGRPRPRSTPRFCACSIKSKVACG